MSCRRRYRACCSIKCRHPPTPLTCGRARRGRPATWPTRTSRPRRPARRSVLQAAAGVVGLLSLAGLLWVEFYTGPGALQTGPGFLADLFTRATGFGMIGVLLAGGYCWWRTLSGAILELDAAY